MAELIVVAYDTPAEADAARKELFGLAKEYLVEVADAVIATADEDRNIKLDQMVNMWTVGATGGAFWGLLAGLIFFNPLLGMAVGAGAGALSAGLSDYGINDDFMKEIAGALQPGQAALFMMMRTEASDRVIERLGTKGGRILRTNLDTDAENHLRNHFDAKRAEMTSESEAD
jgi:uncharacterized membrane protein